MGFTNGGALTFDKVMNHPNLNSNQTKVNWSFLLGLY